MTFRATSVLLLALLAPLQGAGADVVELANEVWRRPGTEDVELDGTLQIHFIDIGGGDGILIDTPSGKKILIDGGWTYSDRGLAKNEYSAYLDRFLEDDVVDLVIISHPDYDHFAGLSNVLDTRTVRQIWNNGYDSSELSQSWGKFIKKARAKEGTVLLSPLTDYMELGTVVRFDDSDTYESNDDVVLTLINSQRYLPKDVYGGGRSLDEGQRRNSCSIVIRMDYGETSALFTGDTNGRKKGGAIDACDDQELFMLRNDENTVNPLFGLLDCDILKVAHHGSDGSSSLRFLTAVQPEWAVISAGVYHKHPTVGALERLAHADVGLEPGRVLRTDFGDPDVGANEENLGDDCYRFYIDPEGVVLVERWGVRIEGE